MSEKKQVLAANSEFYQAFLDRDFDRMNDIWSKREDVAVNRRSAGKSKKEGVT